MTVTGALDRGRESFRRWIRAGWERIRPFATGGNYVNLKTDDDDQGPADAYGKNFERLRRIKAAYDADNLFRVNRNIPPA